MRKTVVAALSSVLLVVGAAGASAAPKSAGSLSLECDDGQTYSVWLAGGGIFTPAHDMESTATLVPIWFGDNSVTVELPDGTVVHLPDEETDAKGGGNVMDRSPRAQISCTYATSFVLEEEEMGFPAGSIVTFSGGVVGYLSGH